MTHYYTKQKITMELNLEGKYNFGSFLDGYVDIVKISEEQIAFNTIIDDKYYFAGQSINEALAKVIFENYDEKEIQLIT